MRSYPPFSFTILIALVKICFFDMVINRAEISLYWEANFSRNPNISDQTRDAQDVCAVAKGGAILNIYLSISLQLLLTFSIKIKCYDKSLIESVHLECVSQKPRIFRVDVGHDNSPCIL